MEITHVHRAMRLTFDKDENEKGLEEGREFTLFINGFKFNELEDAPRERESLARSTTSINMSGYKKHGYFPLLRNGELIPVTVMLN